MGSFSAIDTHSAESALAWLVLAGADCAVGNAPRNWLAESPVPPPPVRIAAAPAAPVPSLQATELANAADSVAALISAVTAFDHPLRRPGLAPMLCDGEGQRGILVMTDMPDAEGSAAERLRTRMLAAIGLDLTGARLARLVPWPTAGGRAVTQAEVAAFAPFVARLLILTQPRAVLAFGSAAASLSGEDGGINRVRGRWQTVAGFSVPMLATFHPRALLNHPDHKPLAWADLQAFAQRIAE